MGFFDFLRPSWNLEKVPPPWPPGAPSLYEHILSHLRSDGPGLRPGGEVLPDEPPADDTQLRWSAGAQDGVGVHHGGWAGRSEHAEAIVEALHQATRREDKVSLRRFYGLIQEEGAIALVDPVMERIRALAQSKRLDVQRVYELALWLARKAPHREPVKVAMAILGMFNGPGHRDLLLTLARHDEFTLYAAVAVLNTFEDPEGCLWSVARNVEGWGRVHAVERLASVASRPEVRRWMIVEGHHNEVMPDYLAFPCAKDGRLLEALRGRDADTEILRGCAELLETLALAGGGPFSGLGDLPDGPDCLRAYLDRILIPPPDLVHFHALNALKGWMGEELEEPSTPESSWTPELRKEFEDRCGALLALPAWRALVEAGLASEDRRIFSLADRAAAHLGMDTWPIHMARLQAGDAGAWFSVAQTQDPGRMGEVVALAEQWLPLKEMATGPTLALFGGSQPETSNALDFVLQSLNRFPGLGWSLIQTGLQHPVIRVRNMAIKALASWKRDQWPQEAVMRVQTCLENEPNPDTRQSLEELLQPSPGHHQEP